MGIPTKPEHLKEKVRMAKEATKDIQDEKRKEKAFELVLQSLLAKEDCLQKGSIEYHITYNILYNKSIK